MITSSLPPELKVVIASGFLLGGGLLALRYPADREEEPVTIQTVVVNRNETPSSPTILPDQTLIAPRNDDVSRFAPIEKFVNEAEHSEWLPTSMTAVNATVSDDMSPGVVETPALDRNHYAGITVANKDAESQETAQVPEYIPFQVTTPATRPEPNPEFVTAKSSPPDLIGLPRLTDESESIVPRAVVSPSALMQSGVSANRVRVAPIATANSASPTSMRTAIARPVVPVPGTPEPIARPVGPVTTPQTGTPQNNVIYATPARTIILPNP
jgi:hypothetical protein